jgi:hypothetical protein
MKLFFFNGIRSGIDDALEPGRSSQGCVVPFADTSILIPEHALRVFL